MNVSLLRISTTRAEFSECQSVNENSERGLILLLAACLPYAVAQPALGAHSHPGLLTGGAQADILSANSTPGR